MMSQAVTEPPGLLIRRTTAPDRRVGGRRPRASRGRRPPGSRRPSTGPSGSGSGAGRRRRRARPAAPPTPPRTGTTRIGPGSLTRRHRDLDRPVDRRRGSPPTRRSGPGTSSACRSARRPGSGRTRRPRHQQQGGDGGAQAGVRRGSSATFDRLPRPAIARRYNRPYRHAPDETCTADGGQPFDARTPCPPPRPAPVANVDEPPHEANAVYAAAIADGLTVGGRTVRLPAPTFADGQSAEEQRAALRELAGSDRAAEALLRDSVTAPFRLKLDDERGRGGDRPVGRPLLRPPRRPGRDRPGRALRRPTSPGRSRRATCGSRPRLVDGDPPARRAPGPHDRPAAGPDRRRVDGPGRRLAVGRFAGVASGRPPRRCSATAGGRSRAGDADESLGAAATVCRRDRLRQADPMAGRARRGPRRAPLRLRRAARLVRRRPDPPLEVQPDRPGPDPPPPPRARPRGAEGDQRPERSPPATPGRPARRRSPAGGRSPAGRPGGTPGGGAIRANDQATATGPIRRLTRASSRGVEAQVGRQQRDRPRRRRTRDQRPAERRQRRRSGGRRAGHSRGRPRGARRRRPGPSGSGYRAKVGDRAASRPPSSFASAAISTTRSTTPSASSASGGPSGVTTTSRSPTGTALPTPTRASRNPARPSSTTSATTTVRNRVAVAVAVSGSSSSGPEASRGTDRTTRSVHPAAAPGRPPPPAPGGPAPAATPAAPDRRPAALRPGRPAPPAPPGRPPCTIRRLNATLPAFASPASDLTSHRPPERRRSPRILDRRVDDALRIIRQILQFAQVHWSRRLLE